MCSSDLMLWAELQPATVETADAAERSRVRVFGALTELSADRLGAEVELVGFDPERALSMTHRRARSPVPVVIALVGLVASGVASMLRRRA